MVVIPYIVIFFSFCMVRMVVKLYVDHKVELCYFIRGVVLAIAGTICFNT